MADEKCDAESSLASRSPESSLLRQLKMPAVKNVFKSHSRSCVSFVSVARSPASAATDAHRRRQAPEDDRAHLCSIKLVVLNVIITHVQQNDLPTLGADTAAVTRAAGHFIFLVITVGL